MNKARTAENRKGIPAYLHLGNTRLGQVRDIEIDNQRVTRDYWTDGDGKPAEAKNFVTLIDGRKFRVENMTIDTTDRSAICHCSAATVVKASDQHVALAELIIPVRTAEDIMRDAAELVERNPEMREALKQVLSLALLQNVMKNVPPKK